jgi:hypothetical protein
LPVSAATSDELPAVAEKAAGWARHQGLLDLAVDEKSGKVWLVVPPPAQPDGVAGEYLYIEGLVTGIGSNPVGLDRGQIGATRLVQLRRIGSTVLIEAQNLSFRARSQEAAERAAVRQSFATSVLWAGEIGALDADGTALVDLTSFIVRDAHGIEEWLGSDQPGRFTLDRGRSVVLPESCLAFPENIELEAMLTYTATGGPDLESMVPDGRSFTLIQHHSLVKLPDAGYRPRRFDPRTASFAVAFKDYAAGLDEPLEQRWIVRHRLEKRDPAAASSPAVEPIVYYVDRGVPEPVRSALVEGASWWAEAFAAAGFEDGFRVELLPEGAHPLDLRYNVIQWVHRSTRGWSYGGGVRDPRTGEMIKAHVTLGSLRVRHDILLFEGLLGTEKTGSGADDDPIELALARIRQLSAHEVGHTLGFSHNYAASTYAGRASVMDYPAPLIRPGSDGALDVSDAYTTGIGVWDRHTVRYAYSQLPPGVNEEEMLEGIIRDGLDAGLLFLSDADARGPAAAHPLASLWDNGADPVAELEQVLQVRRIALDSFGEHNLAPGRPLALLHEVLVPVYFYHRYQAEAAAKSIGGISYNHAVRGDGQAGVTPVPGERQRYALQVLLRALDPEALDIPEPVLALMYPRAFGYERNREMFEGQAEPAFDPLAAAATATDLVVQLVLQPKRLARLVDLHRREPSLPGAEEVLGELVDAVFPKDLLADPRLAEIQRIEQQVVAERLVELTSSPATSAAMRTRVELVLRDLAERLAEPVEDRIEHSLRSLLKADIERYLERREWTPLRRPPALPLPPGSPIGDEIEPCSAYLD